MNFVDPDGNRWVNSKGQVIYDSNGLTAHATREEADLANTMQKTSTGRKQLKKIAEAPFDVEVIIDEHTLLIEGYGRTYNTISHPKGNTEQYKVKKSIIILFKRKARLRPGFLSTMESLAVNFAHEIEHITDKNLRIQLKYGNDNYPEAEAEAETEKDPKKIANDMIREFYYLQPLKSTDDLCRLLNYFVQSNKNIQINFIN